MIFTNNKKEQEGCRRQVKYMLGVVLLWIVVYLSGMLFCKICGEKETSQLWKHLIGFFVLIFCQGGIFFGGQLLHWSFQRACLVLTIILMGICGFSLLVCKKEILEIWQKIKGFSFKKVTNGRYYALILWLLFGIGLVVTFKTAGNRNDAMVETVQTTLMTNTMNEYHPFTRQKLELGMILSKKIITLPFFYSMLSVWTGFDGVTIVWNVGTLLTIVCSLMAVAELGGLLFFRDFKKTWLLLLFMELMYLSGDYYAGATGYRQLFYGYSGEVMVATITIPCILCILYRFFGPILREDFPKEKEHMGWIGALLSLGLCLGSSFFLTSFVWGILMVLFGMVLFAISIAGVRLTKRKRAKGETV